MRYQWLIHLLFAWYLGTTAADAKITFYGNFDASLTATCAAGVAQPIDEVKVNYVNGVIGKAMQVCRQGPSYYTEKHLAPIAGTVAFWIQPTWDGTNNPGNVTLFDVSGDAFMGKSMGKLYKYHEQPYLTYWFPTMPMDARPDEYNRLKQFTLIAPAIQAWKKGEWHHVAISWAQIAREGAISLKRAIHVDGKCNGADTVPLQGLNTPSPDYYFLVGASGDAFDELYIWDEALSSTNIQQIYAAGTNGQTLAIQARADITNSAAGEIRAKTQAANLLANSSFEVGAEDWFPLFGLQDNIHTQAAFHGQSCLRMSAGTGVRSQSVPVVPNKKYTFSVFLKSDPPGMAVDLGVASSFNHHAGQYKIGKRVTVTNQWQRYALSGVLKHFPKDGYGVAIHAGDGSTGQLYVDAVQLRQEGTAGDYAPAAFVETGGFVVGPQDGIFLDNEDIVFDAFAAVNSPIPVAITKTVRLCDYYEREIYRWEKIVTVDVNHPSRDRLVITPEARRKRRGMVRFYVEAKERGKDQGALAETICAIVDHTMATSEFMPQSPFGICAVANDATLDPARKLGCKWTKMMDMGNMVCEWPAVEPEKGKFVWNTAQAQGYAKSSMPKDTAYDEIIDRYWRRGISMVGVLWRCPLWASSAPAALKKTNVEAAMGYPPADLAQWQNYFAAVVKRWKGKIKYWEVWNEPWWNSVREDCGTGEQYGDLVVKTREVLDQLDPEAKVVAFGIMPAGHPAWKCLDVFAVHKYFLFGYPDETKDTWADILNSYCRAPLKKNSGRDDIPVWNMEMAINSGTFYKTKFDGSGGFLQPSPTRDYRSAANCLIRTWVISMANGCEKTIYYFWHDVGGGYHDSRYSLGYGGRTVKPLAIAFATGASLMSRAKFDRQIALEDRLCCYLFKNPGHYLAVCWGRYMDGDMAKLTLPKPAFKIQPVDIMNNEFAPVFAGDKLELPLSAEPVFLKIYAAAERAAQWLAQGKGIGWPPIADTNKPPVSTAGDGIFEHAR